MASFSDWRYTFFVAGNERKNNMELFLGNKITELRKKKGITQEKLANMLGVSTPAVSKWETGTSYPDITILSPLARALGTDLDGLLGFEEFISEERIASISEEIIFAFQTKGNPAAEDLMMAYLWQYPNSIPLKQQAVALITIFELQDMNASEEKRTEWDDKKYSLLQEIVLSENAEYKYEALSSLAAMELQRGNIDKAEEFLSCFPEKISEITGLKVELYMKQNRKDLAANLLQKELFSVLNKSYIYLITILEKDIFERERMSCFADTLVKIDEILHGDALESGIVLAKRFAKEGKTSQAKEALQGYLKCHEECITGSNDLLFAPAIKSTGDSSVSSEMMKQMMMAAIMSDPDLAPLYNE